MLNRLGRHAEALEAIDALLPIRTRTEEVSGERHPEALKTFWLGAEVLHDLGRHAEVLEGIDALLRSVTEIRGERHAETLTTRYLRASILRDLGRCDEALARIMHQGWRA